MTSANAYSVFGPFSAGGTLDSGKWQVMMTKHEKTFILNKLFGQFLIQIFEFASLPEKPADEAG